MLGGKSSDREFSVTFCPPQIAVIISTLVFGQLPFLIALLVAQKAINSIGCLELVSATGFDSLNRFAIEVVVIFTPGMIIGGANGGF